MKLWIGNVAFDTTSDELLSLLQKHGGPGFTELLHVPGDGSRPGVLLTFDNANPEQLYGLAYRLNGLYWKHRGLTAHVMLH